MTEENITHFPKHQTSLAQQQLSSLADTMSQLHLMELFELDAERFQQFSLRFAASASPRPTTRNGALRLPKGSP